VVSILVASLLHSFPLLELVLICSTVFRFRYFLFFFNFVFFPAMCGRLASFLSAKRTLQ